MSVRLKTKRAIKHEEYARQYGCSCKVHNITLFLTPTSLKGANFS